MKFKYLFIFFLVHWGLSLVGFMGISAWAIALQDAGPTALADSGAQAVDLRWLEMALRFGLLQPLAYWVMQSVEIDWWVWTGLIQLSALLAANSVIVAGLLAAGCRRLNARRSRR